MLPVLLCWIIKLFGWSKRFKCLGKDYRFFWREIELGFARTCYRPKLCLLLSSIFHSLVSDLKNLVQSSKSKSTLTQQHVQEKGICSHPQKQGKIYVKILIDCNQSLQSEVLRTVEDEKKCWKAVQRTALTGLAQIYFSRIFWAICYWKWSSTQILLHYWPTILVHP